MKKFILMLFIPFILGATTTKNFYVDVTVVKTFEYGWNISCKNNVDYYTMVKTPDKRVVKVSCSYLGEPGDTVSVPRRLIYQ